MPRGIFLLLSGIAALALAAPSSGEPVELSLANNLTARAEFRKGDAAKPTVLLLHGFLQTHEFPTIHRLTEGLADAGYSVLAPTLTLGVTYRKQSLACEAIHTHTMEDGAKEIAAWVDWLKARGLASIVLIGHSFGSVETFGYLRTQRDPRVRKFIGISVVEARLKNEGNAREALVRETRARVKAQDKSLISRRFSFCQNYLATPESMLSYIEWTPDRIISETARLPIPTTFIMGGRDDRLASNWIERLKQTKAKVRVIEGANHFMDGEFEFDLLDTVLRELKGY